MYIGLTGSPRISGVTHGEQASVSGAAVDESIVQTRRGGLEVVVEERFRLEGEVVWRHLSEDAARTLQIAIGQTCSLDLRTQLGADPSWSAELTVDVRRVSPIEMSGPLRPSSPTSGRPLTTVQFRWRSVATYTLAELGVDDTIYVSGAGDDANPGRLYAQVETVAQAITLATS